MTMDAMMLFIVVTIAATLIQTTSSKEGAIWFGICWPAVCFLGVPALIGIIARALGWVHDNGDKLTPQDILTFAIGWAGIFAITTTP